MKVGQRVRIVAGYTRIYWLKEMERFLGETGEITETKEERYRLYKVTFSDNTSRWYYPDCLEPVDEQQLLVNGLLSWIYDHVAYESEEEHWVEYVRAMRTAGFDPQRIREHLLDCELQEDQWAAVEQLLGEERAV